MRRQKKKRKAVFVVLVAAVAAIIAGYFVLSGNKENPVVIMETSEGRIKIELWEDKAPVTVKNFLQYVGEKFYDGTIFHRVIPKFMIQGGGMTVALTSKPTHLPIKNESNPELKNKRGTIAMARTDDLDSATAQFFINVVDNVQLDPLQYAVFGQVVEGMDVVDKIENIPTTTVGFYRDVPKKNVIIGSVSCVESE